MTVQPTALDLAPAAPPHNRRRTLARRLRVPLLLGCAIFLALMTVGSSATLAPDAFRITTSNAVSGWSFDLTRWEAKALAEKARNAWERPAAGLSPSEGAAAVKAYLARADEIHHLEDEIGRLMRENQSRQTNVVSAMLGEVEALRAQQEQERPIAEAVLQSQITQILAEAGMGVAGRPLPPVAFTFTESPRKLVVSPRSRINSVQARILDPGMPLDAVEGAETAIEASDRYSAYVAQTGGMGAFPTMVVDDASLEWILSTIAHEWVHTYLAFFPLGFNYGSSQENTTINETVAELVGDEIGRRALQRFYPELVIPDGDGSELLPMTTADEPPTFDFRREMAETRRTADRLLAFGRVEDAEQYMEIRRLLFAENGYHLRRLNQAYFAFHGSYGTGAAADVSSPDAIAPLLTQLWERKGDPRSFLHAVRGITDRAGLQEVMAQMAGGE